MGKERTVEIEAARPTDFTIGYWYDRPQDMPESEIEHVKEMLAQGYVEGELNDANENRGWWRIIRHEKAH